MELKQQEGANPLPAANSRRLFCFRRLGEIRRSLASLRIDSPATVAEGGRSPELWTRRAVMQSNYDLITAASRGYTHVYDWRHPATFRSSSIRAVYDRCQQWQAVFRSQRRSRRA